MTAWAHLPNAQHIDDVLKHVKQHPEKWNAAWNARSATWNVALNAAWSAAQNAAWSAAHDAIWGAAQGAVLALIAWDDCAHILKLHPGAVKLMISAGSHAAVLMYPAVLVMNKGI